MADDTAADDGADAVQLRQRLKSLEEERQLLQSAMRLKQQQEGVLGSGDGEEGSGRGGGGEGKSSGMSTLVRLVAFAVVLSMLAPDVWKALAAWLGLKL